MDEKTTSCQDCGTELPWPVVEAGNWLFHEGSISGADLGEAIAEYLTSKSRTDAHLTGIGLRATTDIEQVQSAIISWIGHRPEHLAAAVRHYGDMGGRGISECERIEEGNWCQERGPGKNSQDVAVWAASLCNLAFGHAEPHSFEVASAETVAP